MPARIMVNNTKIIVTLSSTLNPTNTAYIPFSITIQTDEFTYQQGDIVKFLGKVNGSEIVRFISTYYTHLYYVDNLRKSNNIFTFCRHCLFASEDFYFIHEWNNGLLFLFLLKL
jgi:hypothetical protein